MEIALSENRMYSLLEQCIKRAMNRVNQNGSKVHHSVTPCSVIVAIGPRWSHDIPIDELRGG